MSFLIASISGIRGIPGETLTPESVTRYIRSFARWCGQGTIVIGYDGRPSGVAIKDAARAAVLMSGSDVVDIGLAPTPTVQMAVELSGARGGISITASHNPSEWNGLKFLDHSGVFLGGGEMDEVFRLARDSEWVYAAWNDFGTAATRVDFHDAHIERVLSMPELDHDAVRRRAFTVVVDAVNASGSHIVPELLSRLGCTVIPLACDGTGLFPHTPEPLPENLSGLGQAVAAHRADLGIAVDPDADRLVLYDEKGHPFGEEYTIVSAVESFLSHDPAGVAPAIVVNLSTTRAVEDIAARFGAHVYRTPVGEINVVRKMLETRSVIGGEGSGGVIVPAVHPGRDSMVGIALVLSALARHGAPASLYRASLPDYTIRKFRYPLGEVDPDSAIEQTAVSFQAERLDRSDGLRIDFADGWVHMRRSNTEPIMRVIAEARTAEEAEMLADRIASVAFAPVGSERP